MKRMGLVMLGFLLTGCYFWKQGTALISTYSSARPLEEFLKDPQLPPEERLFLERAQAARKYALETLGLKENKNYTTYIRLDRPYLADVVSACAALSFDQYLWDYPLVGSLPYKGFFDRKDAEEEAAALKAQGLDVMVRGVHAFSTLGWFTDPLFSFMSGYSEDDVADLIIHEQTHATIFFSGQGDFNENLANFVGTQGAMDFLTAKYGADSPQVRSALEVRQDQETFRKDLSRLYLELDGLYSAHKTGSGSWAGKPEAEKEKDRIILAFRKDFRDNYSRRYLTDTYLGFPDRPFGNAYIMTFRNYNSGQDAFLEFYRACGEDLVRMIRELKTLPADEKDPLGWMNRRGEALRKAARAASPSDPGKETL